MLAFALLAASPQLDFLDGKALGFESKNVYLVVDCYTQKGAPVTLNAHCFINIEGEWLVSLDDHPFSAKSLSLRIGVPNYLVRKYVVAIPKKGRPKLTVDHADFVFGDLDENNRIDKQDIKLVQEAVGFKKGDTKWDQDIISVDNFEYAKFYDFNHDNKVDTTDVALVQKNLGRVGE